MCLIKETFRNIPKDGAIRYKVLSKGKRNGKLYSGLLFSYTETIWRLGHPRKKELPYGPSYTKDGDGFHVLCSLSSAKDFIKYVYASNSIYDDHLARFDLIIVKCRCERFTARGRSLLTLDFQPHAEIWRKVTPLEIIKLYEK